MAKYKKKSQFYEVWRRLKKNKLAMCGLAIIVILAICAVAAPLLAPYDPAEQDLTKSLLMPCAEHPLGTDNYGRDILSRIIYGGRISMVVAILSVLIGLVLGGLLGSTAAFFGGVYENIIMRLMDILLAIPPFLLAISISASIGSGVINTAVAIGIATCPSFARVIRASVLSLKQEEYIEAATLCGLSRFKIIIKHLIPNSMAPIIVQATLRIGDAILSIASLSFIGLGVQPPTPEWGSMLNYGREFIRTFWPICTFPGIAIVITMIAFNVLGDGLRDALDPRLKQ